MFYQHEQLAAGGGVLAGETVGNLTLTADDQSVDTSMAVLFTIGTALDEWYLREVESLAPLDDTYKTSGTTQSHTFPAPGTYRIEAFGKDAGRPYKSEWVEITVT